MSQLKSKVVIINKRRTSVRLCNSEWVALEGVCKRERISRNKLIESIENQKNQNLGLTGSIRLFSIIYYHTLAEELKPKTNIAYKNEYLEKILNNVKF
ncbi:MAG: ribbon-helix-helix domain-containing protein [Lactobacillus sp.]|jgi:predicted DNA-binding ribbon-helix-helix protein|nr:ribbon-helix-helix domain-containing protein [Lactobacillus sp.]